MSHTVVPEFREWSIAAVRLLQGVVYSDDEKAWNAVLSSHSQLESYVARLGLLLVVDEAEGLAYVRQADQDELPDDYERLPKLFHRSRLGYWTTLLCVLLREELRRFEEEDLHNERCVVEISTLFDQWKAFFPTTYDEVRQRRELDLAVSKLSDLGFVRRFSEEPEAWEIRRILKARLPASELENLKTQLLAAGERRAAIEKQGDDSA
jgi:hypothetical protein